MSIINHLKKLKAVLELLKTKMRMKIVVILVMRKSKIARLTLTLTNYLADRAL